jgi:hypothetical protein
MALAILRPATIAAHEEEAATAVVSVRNRTLTLIEREDDTRSWGNFLVYFSQPKGLGLHIYS